MYTLIYFYAILSDQKLRIMIFGNRPKSILSTVREQKI